MASTSDYVLPRDYLDNNRINLQHYLWAELFGYLAHPAIPTQDPHLRIADVGTGTGIWLTDLASRLPKSVHLDGLDISFDATPPPEWLPPNMTLRHCDIKADIPEELVGVYDIVHIRHFIFVLLDDDLKPVLTNLIRLLKPGGYLQWGEPDIASFRIEKTNPGNKVDALSKLLKISQPQDTRFSPKWVPNLPTLFTDGGLENVQSDVRDAPPHLALAKHENALPVHEFIARKLRNEGLIQELKKLIPEVAKETRQGACWAFTRWTVVGRKPLGN